MNHEELQDQFSKLWDVVMELRGMLKAHLNENAGSCKHLSRPFGGKVIYVAGKITDTSPERVVANIELACEVARELSAKGHHPIVPHLNTEFLEGSVTFGNNEEKWRKAMRHDIAYIHQCDAVFFLDNWKTSLGATLEWYVAHALSRTIYYDINDVPDLRKQKLS